MRFRRRRDEPMPERFEALALYNSEVHRGIAHTADYEQRMAKLQREFNIWIARTTKPPPQPEEG